MIVNVHSIEWQRALQDLDDGDLWLPSSRKELVDDLVDALHERQHAVLVGEPGVGKTCSLRGSVKFDPWRPCSTTF